MIALKPRVLSGSPFERGHAQAGLAGVDAAAVRATVEERFAAARGVLETLAARHYLARQRAFCEAHCAPELAEFSGVCAGFGIDERQLFALFHLSALSHAFETDGCSAWARRLPGGGAVLAKNRDLSGPHRSWQETFLHLDPASPGGAVLAVGTLGAPGVYSSGMNAAGLALADTAISAPMHGVGWPRYFLMTRLLAACMTLPQAIDLVAGLRHAGGGSLILADAAGEVAAIELFHDGARIDRSAPAFRTNHFWAEPADDVARRLAPASLLSTLGRRDTIDRQLGAGLGLDGLAPVMAAMADHGDSGREALCRHGGADGSHTVSCAIYDTRALAVAFSRGAPCEGGWETGRIPDWTAKTL